MCFFAAKPKIEFICFHLLDGRSCIIETIKTTFYCLIISVWSLQHSVAKLTTKFNSQHSRKCQSPVWPDWAIYWCCFCWWRWFFKKWANPGLFYHLFSVFSIKHHFNFYNKYMWKMSIQYMVPGFEPMTFGTWVSTHNH